MDANSYLVTELIDAGLNRREARWLVEEFSPDRPRGDRRHARRRPTSTGRRADAVRARPLALSLPRPRPRSAGPHPATRDRRTRRHRLRRTRCTRRLTEPLIVDLGCGSGAIGLSLLFELRQLDVHATLVAVDSSRDALDVTRANAEKHDLRRHDGALLVVRRPRPVAARPRRPDRRQSSLRQRRRVRDARPRPRLRTVRRAGLAATRRAPTGSRPRGDNRTIVPVACGKWVADM